MMEQQSLHAYLKQFDSLAVAVSGGVDSALLLREAASCLGTERVLALTVKSEFTPAHEIAMAKRAAKLADVEHVLLEVCALDDEMIADNGPLRCYYCKRRLFLAMRDEAWLRGYLTLCDGTNADDEGDYRPGRRALEELEIVSPFLSCGMGKKEIYALSHGMPTQALPAYACLATRIPTGTPITLDALYKVEAAEDAIRALGFPAVRVRCHGDLARIELAPDRLEEGFSKREALAKAVIDAGFAYASLDLLGYRRGSMNKEGSQHGGQ